MHTFVRLCSLRYAAFRSLRVHVLCTLLGVPARSIRWQRSISYPLATGECRSAASASMHRGRSASNPMLSDGRWRLSALLPRAGVDAPQVDRRTTFGDLIRQHITDMAEVGKARSEQGKSEKIQGAWVRFFLLTLHESGLSGTARHAPRKAPGPSPSASISATNALCWCTRRPSMATTCRPSR